jgi:hypothetical protein
MRLSVILGICVVLCGAMVADASIIPGNNDGYNLTFSANVTTFNASFDRVDLYMTGLLGPATAGTGINIIEGTWSMVGGGTYNLASDAAIAGYSGDIGPKTWVDFTDSGLGASGLALLAPYGQVGPCSFIGFASSANWLGTGRPTEAGEAYPWFAANWNSGGSSYIAPGVADTATTRFARFYVPTGTATHILFTGKIGFNYGGGTVESGTLSFVPEPGTVALLISGVVGLAVYAWRKRK